MTDVLYVGEDARFLQRLQGVLGERLRVRHCTACLEARPLLRGRAGAVVVSQRGSAQRRLAREFPEHIHIAVVPRRTRARVVRALVDDGVFAVVGRSASDAELWQTLYQARHLAGLRAAGTPPAEEPQRLRRQGAEMVADADPGWRSGRLHGHEEDLLVMAHDVRAPLSVMVGYAHLLRSTETGLSANGQPMLDRVQQTGQRLLDMVERIVQLGTAEKGEPLLQPSPVRLADLAAEVREDLAPLAEARRQRFSVQASGHEGPYALDRSVLLQALYNLVTNAIKYTPPGGNIALSLHGEPDRITCRVSDTGRGFSEADKRRFVDPEADEPADARSHGNGLGLSIVRRNVALLQGRVDVESRPGQGSTVTVTLRPGRRPSPPAGPTRKPY